ncbi:LytTR family DNA-binding domain-containing protein [Pedobacter sp. Leaf216]|uniref:LytTR family DNA-binding domain-containing protein n=1 Tax=Pedobacter sp. Leaf216 TaxID=1735684 RepID=UPI0009EB8625
MEHLQLSSLKIKKWKKNFFNILVKQNSYYKKFCWPNKVVMIYTDNGDKFLTELSLSELEGKLPSSFLRVQRSYIINTEKILEINRYFNNGLIILMNDNEHTKIISGTTYINQIRLALDL